MAIPSSDRLATIRSQGGSSYPLTREDVLWVGRLAAFEGGDPAAAVWALTQRFVWFEDRGTFYPTFADFARAFSQPINPRWARDGEFCRPGGKYHGSKYCQERRLVRRERASTVSWAELQQEEPGAVRAVELWAQGALANPVPRATNWADPEVASSYLQKNPGAELVAKRGNWFLSEPSSVNWPDDYVFMEAPTGAIADASGVRQPGIAVAFGRGVTRAIADWWRLV